MLQEKGTVYSRGANQVFICDSCKMDRTGCHDCGYPVRLYNPKCPHCKGENKKDFYYCEICGGMKTPYAEEVCLLCASNYFPCKNKFCTNSQTYGKDEYCWECDSKIRMGVCPACGGYISEDNTCETCKKQFKGE